MSKYKAAINKLVSAFRLKRPGRKGLAVIIAAVLLVGGAGAYLALKGGLGNDGNQDSAYSPSDRSKTSFAPTDEACRQHISELENIKLNPEDGQYASLVYNRLAGCYYEFGEYKKALEAAEKMKEACKLTAEHRCFLAADALIDNAKNPPKSRPASERGDGPRNEKTPEIQRELDEEEAGAQ